MSKIHSKINFLKTIALATIGTCIFLVIIQMIITANSIISSQANIPQSTNLLTVQQQNIYKAYDKILSISVDPE